MRQPQILTMDSNDNGAAVDVLLQWAMMVLELVVGIVAVKGRSDVFDVCCELSG